MDNDFWSLLGEIEKKDEFINERIVLEHQALDLFSNLVFSTILFWKKTHCWPEKITVRECP
jgi:hypothetical protein